MAAAILRAVKERKARDSLLGAAEKMECGTRLEQRGLAAAAEEAQLVVSGDARLNGLPVSRSIVLSTPGSLMVYTIPLDAVSVGNCGRSAGDHRYHGALRFT
jgi:hypothetical protein